MNISNYFCIANCNKLQIAISCILNEEEQGTNEIKISLTLQDLEKI